MSRGFIQQCNAQFGCQYDGPFTGESGELMTKDFFLIFGSQRLCRNTSLLSQSPERHSVFHTWRVYLNGDSVCQSPDGHRVQASISQVCDSAPQHLHISAAVQLVPQLQLVFVDTKQQKSLTECKHTQNQRVHSRAYRVSPCSKGPI